MSKNAILGIFVIIYIQIKLEKHNQPSTSASYF